MDHNQTGHGGHEGHGGMGTMQNSAIEDLPKDLPDSTFGGHNQMMVGEQTIFLSHLPMFMFDNKRHEHNFQVILEVTLSGDSQGKYVNDRRSHPNERMYTMQPAPFEMVELDPRRPRRSTLTGVIYRGHLERGGVEIIGHIDPTTEEMISPAVAQVVNIVYFHKFHPKAELLEQLEYILFGKGQELFLAHRITRPPDFDQIISVTVSGHQFTADELSRGVRIRVPDRANRAHTRIKAGQQVTGQAQLSGAQAAPPMELQITAGTEFYFEEGELHMMTMRQTPEEKEAGF